MTESLFSFFFFVAVLRPATLLKNRLWQWCFPVNFGEFLRTSSFLQNTCGGCFCCSMKYKTQKRWKHEDWKKRNLKKSKTNRVSCFNIYIVVLAFLSSTEDVGRWQKLNEIFVFGRLFICYVWLLQLLWKFS